MASKALTHYFRILEGEEESKYLVAKKRMLHVDLNDKDDVLWKVHESTLREDGTHHSQRGHTSLLDLKIRLANRMMRRCTLCERRCGVNRNEGEKGHCGVAESRISSDFIHMGEEPDLTPSYTIFFSGCTFNCVYCQNWDISTKPDSGSIITPEDLAHRIEGHARREGLPRGLGTMLGRARNVNWVGGDPTSNLPYILTVLRECSADIPQVWNSNMYLTEDSMSLLAGVVDVFLSDFKYGNDTCAMRLSNAPDYTRIIKRNHLIARENAEMIIRHLVLPGHIDCCTRPALTWISENLLDVKVNVMAQYHPEFKAREYAEISRPLATDEFELSIRIAKNLGLDLCD